jgi:hypothetical protein
LLEGAGRQALGNVNIERFQEYLRNPPTTPPRTLAERTEREQFALAQSYLVYERRLNPGLSEAAFNQHVLSSGPSSLGGAALGAAGTVAAPATALTDSIVSVLCAFSCIQPPPPPPQPRDACSTFACLNGFQQGEALAGVLLLVTAPELRIGSVSPASASRLGVSTSTREGISVINAEVRAAQASESAATTGLRGVPDAPEVAGIPNLRTGDALAVGAIPRNTNRAVIGQGEGTVTCTQTSCGMVLDTLGRPVDPIEIIRQRAPGANGLPATEIPILFRNNGIDAISYSRRSVDDLARYTANGTPVIATVRNADGTFHAVVVDGVTTRSINGVPTRVVAIRDPARGGSSYFSPATVFQSNFSGFVTVPRSPRRP